MKAIKRRLTSTLARLAVGKLPLGKLSLGRLAPGNWSLRRVLGVVIVANLLLGLILFGLHSPKRVGSTPATTAPPYPPQIEQLQQVIDSQRHGEPYTLELSDADLTATVARYLSSRPNIPFAQVRVAVIPGKVVVDGVTKGFAVNVPVRVTAVGGARDGLPWARAENVSLGDTPVPGFIRDQIVAQVNANLDFSRYDLAVTVDSLEFRQGSIVVSGKVK